MKVRISGSPDLVRAWAAQFETHLGIKGREYPNRNSTGIRYFLDLDDRQVGFGRASGPPTTRKPSNGAVGGSPGEKQPKDGHGGR